MSLKFTAPGAVVPPREIIADIVPAEPRLVIEPVTQVLRKAGREN